MLAIDSVKLVIMLRNAALSVTEPIAGFRSQVVVGSGCARISCRVSKSALSLHKTAPQPSACEVTSLPSVPSTLSTSRHDAVSRISSSSKVASKSSSDITKYALLPRGYQNDPAGVPC